jgi:hypothetical protein
MRGSIFKLFAATVLITSSYTHPLKADQPTCAESAATCVNSYAGCAFVWGFPPGTQMICLTACEDGEVTYSEFCDL